ncbi:hypothetical protein JZX86_17900 [Agrobacterium rosae]|uniref:hypothetical protein n=1 Tax=Agrobacterium rosae TaxID=1972867 RepID=UPI0019D4050A|nr:hypothetical protein [Agrobacterium rosae]MBN7807230.1 hypothetical protein [Agrobacterium rosae]
MMGFVFRRTIAACGLLSLLSTGVLAVENGERTADTHRLHYTQAQGSRLIAVSWLQVLKQPEVRSFRPVGLARYGYRPMEGSSQDLTVGFPVTGAAQQQMAGLTCFTCRMPERAVSATRSPIEKDPKSLNFQGLLVDVKTQFASLGKGAF